MRFQNGLFILILALFVAGCAAGPPPAGNAQYGSVYADLAEEGVNVSMAEAGGIADATNWQELRLVARGDPGSWMIAYQEWQVSPGTEFRYRYAVDSTAVGTEDGMLPNVLLVTPTPIIGTVSDGEMDSATFELNLLTTNASENWSFQKSGERFGWTTESYVNGLLFAFGSTSAWTVDVQVSRVSPSINEGQNHTQLPLLPSNVIAKRGLEFHMAQDSVSQQGAAAVIRLDVETTGPGWTLFQASGVSPPNPPDPLVRAYDVSFANGLTYQEAFRPNSGASPTYLGTWKNVAGANHVEIRTLGQQEDLGLVAVHLSGEHTIWPRPLGEDIHCDSRCD